MQQLNLPTNMHQVANTLLQQSNIHTSMWSVPLIGRVIVPKLYINFAESLLALTDLQTCS